MIKISRVMTVYTIKIFSFFVYVYNSVSYVYNIIFLYMYIYINKIMKYSKNIDCKLDKKKIIELASNSFFFFYIYKRK